MNNTPEKNTKSHNEYWPVYQSTLDWLGQYPYQPPMPGSPSFWWAPLFEFITYRRQDWYWLAKEGADNLIDEIRGFFSRIWTWTATPFMELGEWLYKVWENLKAWVEWAETGVLGAIKWLWEKIEGTWNLIGNTIDWIWWWVYDIWGYIKMYVIDPLVEAWDFLTDTLAWWLENIWAAIAAFLENSVQWVLDLAGQLWKAFKDLSDWLRGHLLESANSISSWIGFDIRAIPGQITEHLRDIIAWFWEQVKYDYYFVKDKIAPAVSGATTGAAGWLKDQFTHLIGLAYNELRDTAMSFTPMTPDKAPQVAGLMFASAAGLGMMAHTISLGVEMIPNLKYMGVHYLSGFLGSMAGFGAITAATMGVIAALAVRLPFTYYMNRILRPKIPDESLLIEFRSKREIEFPEFAQYMSYHGYSHEWTAKTDSWLWKDPRLFEILYCADVTVPPKEWLVRKFERAGYEDIDIDVLCRVVERRTTRSPRTYYTTSLRRNYRHGFLTESELVEGIDALEMAPDAIDWIKRAGELDNIYEVNSDWVTTYKTAYRNDLITEDEMGASLFAMGLPEDRVAAIIELEYVRKRPRILAAERKEIEAGWRDIQAKYSRVYIESFRRGLITEGQLSAYLASIGINNKVAMATARHEAIKLLPKAKPEGIPIPLIPAPPAPPTYED